MNYIIALFIPILLIFLGGLVKKLVRGVGWKPRDFFLGVELSLASVASALIYIFELSNSPANLERAKSLGVYTVTCLFLFFVVMAFHQEWERKPQNPKGQLFWLGGFCNLMGIALLATFVIFVKGVA